jgi:hypothetical protein
VLRRPPCDPSQRQMASSENSFFGLKVPEGNDRRELYKSQYRAIYTCKHALSCTAQHTCRAARLCPAHSLIELPFHAHIMPISHSLPQTKCRYPSSTRTSARA